MGTSEEDEVEQARSRLEEILAKARKLEVPTNELLSTRPAKKLLYKTSDAFNKCAVKIGLIILVLAGLYVYARWPTQEVETVRTVLRRTCSTRDIVDRIAALLHSSSPSSQDDC